MPSPAVRTSVPDFRVHRTVGELVTLSRLVAGGAAVFHFYVFAFTGGPEGG